MTSHHILDNADTATNAGASAGGDLPLSLLLGSDDAAEEAAEREEGELVDRALKTAEASSAAANVDAEAQACSEGLATSVLPPLPLGEGIGEHTAQPSPTDIVQPKPFREDARVDRRIIEGMLRDRDLFMDQMENEGFSQGAVLRRAAELGLSEALIRQVKGVAADLAGERPGRRAAPSSLGARTCLSCDRVFLSSGPGNRLCMRCRGGDAGLAQL